MHRKDADWLTLESLGRGEADFKSKYPASEQVKNKTKKRFCIRIKTEKYFALTRLLLTLSRRLFPLFSKENVRN